MRWGSSNLRDVVISAGCYDDNRRLLAFPTGRNWFATFERSFLIKQTIYKIKLKLALALRNILEGTRR
jgi:hypothetical protein